MVLGRVPQHSDALRLLPRCFHQPPHRRLYLATLNVLGIDATLDFAASPPILGCFQPPPHRRLYLATLDVLGIDATLDKVLANLNIGEVGV
jgi:hypothetical protein